MRGLASAAPAPAPRPARRALRHCGARPTCRRSGQPTAIGRRRGRARRECDSGPTHARRHPASLGMGRAGSTCRTHMTIALLAEPVSHGLSQKAVELGRPFGFPITNSMVVTWIVALALIVFAQVATRKMTDVPSGPQNLLEWLIEGLYGLLESMIGSHLVERTFWFFGTVFIFILAANWLSLVPGVGTIGWGHTTPHGFVVQQPLFRGANADLNLTLAMALVFFACWIYWALRETGPAGIVKELFAPKGDTTGFLKVLMIIVFFAAGCLEIVSILFRPISLSFRLYGNVFAGETMLETMSTIVPGLGWLLPIPFY